MPVFLLNPKNEAFVKGLAAEPEDENPPWSVVVKLGVIAATAAFVSYWLYKIGRVFAMQWGIVLVVLFMLFAAYATLRPIIVSRRFRRPCKVVFGELLACEVINDDGAIYWTITLSIQESYGRDDRRQMGY